jgi:catechol 2,3-dioxygenase-like lactoylglutathione lyase family enzyme
MNLNTSTNLDTHFKIHPVTRLGPVSLMVTDLERQIAFHRDILGMKLHWREGDQAGMGAGGEDLLHFVERRQAVRRAAPPVCITLPSCFPPSATWHSC